MGNSVHSDANAEQLGVLTRFHARPAAHDDTDHLWVLAGLPVHSAHTLDRWLEALHNLTREQWARVARESASAERATRTDDIKRLIVAAIRKHRLEVAAWFLRDAVETTVHYAVRTGARATEVSPSEITRIHRATEWAALAIAAESWLDPSVCDTLIAPFELTLPSASPQLL
jgi:hypothetical protein